MYSLSDAIIEEDIQSVRKMLRYGNINQVDEYGFTPLIEASIVDNMEIAEILLREHADANLTDVTGGTALQWAVENNNVALCKLLLSHRANPNAYNLSGQPVLAMPILRHQSALKKCLVDAGADITFAQDYVNTKLLGHMFELVGTASIVDTQNQFVEVDMEGFYLEVTLGIIAESVHQFQNHFAAKQLRRYSGLAQFIVKVMLRASELIKYQQYRIDIRKYTSKIDSIIREEPLVIPVGYEGHAITFIKYGDIWVKCDRREDSRLFDNVMFYRILNLSAVNADFVKNLIYVKQTSLFVNETLDQILGLEPITDLKVPAQISGNCSWANVEATIPALFFMVLMSLNQDKQSHAYYKTLSLQFFSRWREWNKERALHYCIDSFKKADSLRAATKAELLAAILFQSCSIEIANDRARIDMIMKVLMGSPYEYLIKNYLRIYHYEGRTEEGKRFAELVKDYGYKV